MSQKGRWFWITFAIWLIADQVTKFWVYLNIEYRVGQIDVIPGFFSIVHAQNPGAAFSMLADFPYKNAVFYVFFGVACWVVWDAYRKVADADRVQATALGMVLSGAAGNIIDRLHKGTVTDFMRFHVEEPTWRARLIDWFGTNEYPSWNVADAALLVGIVVYLAASGLTEEEAETPPEGSTPA